MTENRGVIGGEVKRKRGMRKYREKSLRGAKKRIRKGQEYVVIRRSHAAKCTTISTKNPIKACLCRLNDCTSTVR